MNRPRSVVQGARYGVGDGDGSNGKTGLTRRHCIALGSTAALLDICAVSAAPPTPSDQGNARTLVLSEAGLIVGGPDSGPLAVWAHLLGAAIGHRIGAADQSLHLTFVGGADGVTAANQFEARTAPDGSTALLVSGSSAMAWLTGDQRAQFDAGRWLGVATGLASGVVLRAPPTSASTTSSPTDGRLRLAAGAADLAVPATLGLSLIGVETQLVVDADEPLTAMRQGRADMVFLHGPNATDATAAARALGATPVFSLGVVDDAGSLTRDPQVADVPTLPELMMMRQGSSTPRGLLPAWRAVAAAAQIEFALVLPWLTPAATVSQWRKAASQMNAPARTDFLADTALRHAQAKTLRLQTDPAANFGLSAIAVDANTLLDFRRWKASRSP